MIAFTAKAGLSIYQLPSRKTDDVLVALGVERLKNTRR